MLEPTVPSHDRCPPPSKRTQITSPSTRPNEWTPSRTHLLCSVVFGWCSVLLSKTTPNRPQSPAKPGADARIRTADPFITSLRATHREIRSFAGNSGVRPETVTLSNSAVLHAPPGMCSNGVPIVQALSGGHGRIHSRAVQRPFSRHRRQHRKYEVRAGLTLKEFSLLAWA